MHALGSSPLSSALLISLIRKRLSNLDTNGQKTAYPNMCRSRSRWRSRDAAAEAEEDMKLAFLPSLLYTVPFSDFDSMSPMRPSAHPIRLGKVLREDVWLRRARTRELWHGTRLGNPANDAGSSKIRALW